MWGLGTGLAVKIRWEAAFHSDEWPHRGTDKPLIYINFGEEWRSAASSPGLVQTCSPHPAQALQALDYPPAARRGGARGQEAGTTEWPPSGPPLPRSQLSPGRCGWSGDLETALMDWQAGGPQGRDCLVGSDLTLNCRRKSLYLSLQI